MALNVSILGRAVQLKHAVPGNHGVHADLLLQEPWPACTRFATCVLHHCCSGTKDDCIFQILLSLPLARAVAQLVVRGAVLITNLKTADVPDDVPVPALIPVKTRICERVLPCSMPSYFRP